MKASGCGPAISSFRAWMPSKMAISSGPSLSDLLGSMTRIRRANSYFGTKMRSPLVSAAKCSFSSSMSRQRGLSKS